MSRGVYYQKTFMILAGAVLVFLLAFYGLVGPERPSYSSMPNRVRTQSQKKVVHFSVRHKDKNKDSFLEDDDNLHPTSTLAPAGTENSPRIAVKSWTIRKSKDLPVKPVMKTPVQAVSKNKIAQIDDTTLQPDEEDGSTESTTPMDYDTATTNVEKNTKSKSIDNLRSNVQKGFKSSNATIVNTKNTKIQEDGDFSLRSRSKDVKPQSIIRTTFHTNASKHGNASEDVTNNRNQKSEVASQTDVKKRFAERRQRYDRLCSRKEYKQIQKTKYIKSERSYFAGNRLRWCQIPKIATTFLKYVRKTNRPSVEKQGLTRYTRSQQQSFFLVREPYSRLVSGFLCKIVTTPQFWRRYGLSIISKYRPNASEGSLKCGHDVTFPEFIKYFIKAERTGLDKNKHFMPIHEQCSICHEDYDNIVHLETIKPDLTYIFDRVHVKMDIDIRNTENEIVSKSIAMLYTGQKRENCYFHCIFLRQLWWSFQARGFISSDYLFPFTDEECKTVSVKRFTDLTLEASRQFTDKDKRSKQKRQMMVDLYLQVPLEDRILVKNILWKDFELFEYDAEPHDIFPELFHEK